MIYVTGYLGEGAEYMLRDLHYENGVTVISSRYKVKSHLGEQFIYAIRNILNILELQKLAVKFNNMSLTFQSKDINNNDVVVFFNSAFSAGYFNKEILLDLKKKGAKTVLYIVDAMQSKWCQGLDYLFQLFDLIYSIDEHDCEKYHIKHQQLVISKMQVNEKGGSKYLYFLGKHSERDNLISKIARYVNGNGIQSNFLVLRDSTTDENLYGIKYINKSLPYETNLSYIAQANCLLEVLHDGFHAPTQRYLEAVINNVKLLTNNKLVVNLPYYNPEYIHIFRNIEDIKCDWIKSCNNIDYGYKNEFSPVIFIRRIINELNN